MIRLEDCSEMLLHNHTFDYAYTLWCPLLSKAFKTKLQIAQNKCKRFCLEFPPLGHISPSCFRKTNWLLGEHEENYPLPLPHLNTGKEKHDLT